MHSPINLRSSTFFATLLLPCITMYNNSNKGEWGYSLVLCCTANQQRCAARTILPPNLNLDYVVKSTSKINQVTMSYSYVEPLVPSLGNCHSNKYFSHWYWSTLAKKPQPWSMYINMELFMYMQRVLCGQEDPFLVVVHLITLAKYFFNKKQMFRHLCRCLLKMHWKCTVKGTCICAKTFAFY